ncbi:MAG: hypothetical protein WBB39_00110 [Candidatus Saccharimonadales bacterium]
MKLYLTFFDQAFHRLNDVARSVPCEAVNLIKYHDTEVRVLFDIINNLTKLLAVFLVGSFVKGIVFAVKFEPVGVSV